MRKNLKIFIFLPTWLGDSVMASAGLKLIFKHFKNLDKNAEFYLYGSFVACELFKECENVRVFQAPKKRRFLSFFKLVRTFKKDFGGFDYAFSFRSALSAKIMLFMLASKFKFCLDKRAFKASHQVLKYLFFVKNALNLNVNENLQSHVLKKEALNSFVSVEKFKPSKEFERLDESLKAQIIDETSLFLPFKTAKVHKLSTDLNLKATQSAVKTLGINAGAHYGSAKRWLPEYFAKVALAFKDSHEIVLFGVASEAEICNEIENLLLKNGVRVLNLCGKTSIKELCEAISALDLLITNDSGTMHIAAVYKVRSVVLFGPTNFTQTSPWCNENAALVHLNLTCMPCMKRVCPIKTHACMLELKPEFIITAAKQLLSANLEF